MIQSLWMQCRREFWESRGSFLKTPLWVAAVMAALLIMGMITSGFEIHMALDELREHPEKMQDWEDGASLMQALMSGDLFSSHPEVLRAALGAIGIPFVLVLLLVTQVYLLGCLYQDRRDRSILFWKSLPVSETRTVLTKLAFGALAGPAVFIAASLVVGLVHLLMVLGYGSWQFGVGLPDVGLLLATFVGQALAMISGWLLFALWFLPVFAWLLLASAWARKSPFLVALGLPLAAAVLELWLLRSTHLFSAIATPMRGAIEGLALSQIRPGDWLSLWGNSLTAPALWLGFGASAGFTVAAIWLRNHRYEL